jgi:hypothetical protein
MYAYSLCNLQVWCELRPLEFPLVDFSRRDFCANWRILHRFEVLKQFASSFSSELASIAPV